MSETPKPLTYQPGMSRQTTFGLIKGVAVPIAILALCMFTVSRFGNYGVRAVFPMVSAVWFVGFLVAWYLPVERRETIEQTEGICIIYCCTLLALKVALAISSGASAEMIAASYNQPIPLSTGNALPGVLQNILTVSAFMIPGAYLGMLVKKVVQYKKTENLQKEFARTKGVSNSGKIHTRRY